MQVKTKRRPVVVDIAETDRKYVDGAIYRVTSANLIHGNNVSLLVDATDNYPAWLEAIKRAEQRILFETYIIHDDDQGQLFADALIEKARQGVEVKIIYDWLGGLGNTSRRFWRRLRSHGIEVRCYNPPSLLDPLGIISRDHRKTIVVDGRIAFVSGLCVGRYWVGDETKGVPPWRDTGVGITGPAATEVEAAFADVWSTMGPPLDPLLLKTNQKDAGMGGGTALRVVQSSPGSAQVYRLDQMLAVIARERMWISDAYFIGVPSYLQTLRDASNDGVDVRILVPQSSDIGLIPDTTRSTYRPLLEAGIRIFEWNGPMMHAKTAVFDGRYSRVGSTNLNVASWFGNYELDVLVEDEHFGRKMEEMFIDDMSNSTEIVLNEAYKKREPNLKRRFERKGGSVRKATAGAINAATSIGSAIAGKAPLGAAEAKVLFIASGILIALSALFVIFPRGTSVPVVVLLMLLAIPTLIKAIQSYRRN